MKKRYAALTLLSALVLSACGGNKFEGTYQSSIGGEAGDMMNQMAGAMNQSLSQTMTIGPNYVESNGRRQEMEKIFEREADGKRWLVFQDKSGKEDALAIVDDDTLAIDNGMMKIEFHRKKQ